MDGRILDDLKNSCTKTRRGEKHACIRLRFQLQVQLRNPEMCASARNISSVTPRCVQVQETSVA